MEPVAVVSHYDGLIQGTLAREGSDAGCRAMGSDGSWRSFRNTEFIATRDGKLRDVEVYFGWNIPHDAKPGGFVDKQK
jgi:hypothetical protein